MHFKAFLWFFISINCDKRQKFQRRRIENNLQRYKGLREKNVEKNLQIANRFMQWLVEPQKVHVPIPEPPWLDEESWGYVKIYLVYAATQIRNEFFS